MQSTSLPPQLDDLSDEEREHVLTEVPLRSLADVLATVPDPRSRSQWVPGLRPTHGRKRYDLPFLLTCLVSAMLCNCNSLEAVGEWCQEHQTLLKQTFGPRRHLTPTGSLYRWLLPRLSAVALDGKVLPGAAAPRLLAVTTHTTRETLIEVPVRSKTNGDRLDQRDGHGRRAADHAPWIGADRGSEPSATVPRSALRESAARGVGLSQHNGI